MHHAATLPEITSLEQARGLLSDLSQLNQQLLWRVSQLEQALYGSTSERQTNGTYSKEQILLSLFGVSQPACTENVVVEAKTVARPAKKALPVKEVETVTERLEPGEKVCPHCGKAKYEIGCEVSERYEYIPAKVVRHQLTSRRYEKCCQDTLHLTAQPKEKPFGGTGRPFERSAA